MKKESYDLLVIEDEPVVLSAIRKIIEPEQLRMDEAMNGDIVLSKLRRESYKLIISDLMLPRISGLDLIQEIKQAHPCVPLIVITGYATLEKALLSFKMGSFDFIPKPFDTENFLGVVFRGLNYSRVMLTRGPEEHAYLPVPESMGIGRSAGEVYCLGCHSQGMLQEDGTVLIRVGETFSNMMDQLSRLEIVATDDEIVQGNCCVRFITEDGLINMFWAPLSGKIEAYNEELDRNVQLINTEPYGEGWIFRIAPSNLEEELQHLTMCERGSNAGS